jgi:tRNA-dihydrouridine synthase
MFAQTGCDSVMIGRGALGNPWLFGQCRDILEGREPRTVTSVERIEQALEHLRLFRDRYGERRAATEMKPQVAWYTKGVVGGAKARGQLFRSKSSGELEALLVEAGNRHKGT